MDEIKAGEARKLLIEIENCQADLDKLNRISDKYAGIHIFSNESCLSLSSVNDSEILNMLKFNINCKLETAKDALDAL